MNLDILSQNLIIYISIIFTALVYFVAVSLYRPGNLKGLRKKEKLKKLKVNKLYFLAVIFLSLVTALIIYIVVGHYYETQLPSSFLLMILPATFSLCLLILALFIKKNTRILSVVILLVGVAFSLLLINDYYRYDPTLGYIFGITNTQDLRGNLNSITVNYTLSTKQNSLNKNTVQYSLDHLASNSTNGVLYKINIPGKVSKFKARDGYVYIPAIYNSVAQINLPVIVLTAGIPGTPDNWPGLGLQNIMDQFAKSHDGITPLVFVADSTGAISNDTECVNSPRGNAETYLTVDVPNYIKKNFHVDNSPSNWAIGGLSMGGMCAIMLTLRHPNVYNYFIDLGGELGPEVGSKQATVDTIFDGSNKAWADHQPSLLLSEHSYKNIGGFFGAGSQDNLQVTQAISQLSTESKKAGITNVTEVINGAHTFNVWAQTFRDSLPWISNRIGATQCNVSCL